jgi:tetratricopeptide (TPR) repeat protein
MSDNRLKYIFIFISVFLLGTMICLSRYAGISCDEVLHYGQSEAVYNFYATHGRDQSSLNTPDTHLKYYGQSYDNLVTILIHLFRINDIYRFRHIMSSLAGWAVILLTALFAVWLSGYRTGIIVLFLFAVSPTFIGHAMNNLKDVPFALGYAASIFFILKFLLPDTRSSFSDALFLTLSIALAISIRAGGLLLICYLIFFFFIRLIWNNPGNKSFSIDWKTLIIILLISCAAFLLGILLWPFALQHPLRNVFESYRVMAHFPSTFRQIFEGKMIWSDFMPWYYLPKSMIITIPLIVTAGLLVFFLFTKKIFQSAKALSYSLVIFTIIFPLFFAMVEKSNLYSSWRQFLFIYPLIIIIAATGFSLIFDKVKNRLLRWALFVLIVMFSIHPVRFMAGNRPYFYLYYNQLAGGLRGAYGNYETDYYYIAQTEASEWLIDHLNNNNDSILVKATFSVEWQFRNLPKIRTSYFRYEEKSQYDWDYAITSSRYITPYMLKNKKWPPKDAIHIIYADSIPVCAVLERKTKADYYGYKALEEGKNSDAIKYFEEALKINNWDEMIFYNFARALFNDGQNVKADSALSSALEINPEFEPALMFLGNIARDQGNRDKAAEYYEKVISINRKYLMAYVEDARIIAEKDTQKARKLLRTCLVMNPRFKPAIIALADTYRKTDPDIAEKYDKQAESIK